MLGEEHGEAFIVADPAGIAVAAIREMRRQQSKEAVVPELPLKRGETDFLEYNIAIGIGKDFFMDAIASVDVCVGQLKGGDPGFERSILEGAVAFFFGEKIAAISYDESEITGTSLIDARKIDFVENAVTHCEPDFAVLVKSRTRAGFGA